ncbi:MAG: hypothetical protein LUE87_07305 [Lachnospiraceae bacterium]|nr:hypothetical protein [Lachnospiraceae bacterium]
MLGTKQRKCLELLVSGKFTQKEIAEQIKVSQQTICAWKKNAEFMQEYNGQLKNAIRSMAAKAFRTETELLNADSEMVRLAAAKDILDRAGFKPDDNMNINIEPVMIVDDLKE